MLPAIFMLVPMAANRRKSRAALNVSLEYFEGKTAL
jgi:hypothetical protein